jgi:Ca-activated chloride channel family protein
VTHDFSTGKLRVGSNGNQGLIDATVKVNDAKSDKRIDGGRTYSSPSSNPSEYLLSPGTYTVVLKALPIVGYDADVTIEDVEVKAEDVTEVMHTFEFGELEVKVSNHYGLSDATVKVMDSKGERIFTSGRTYTSESSNPKDFLLSPGAYKIEVKEIGKDASGKQIFDVEIENGQTISKEVKF